MTYTAIYRILFSYEEIIVKLQTLDVDERLKFSEEYTSLIRNKKAFDECFQTWIRRFEISNENVNIAAKSTELLRDQSDVDSLVRSVDKLELKYKCLVRQRNLQLFKCIFLSFI